jgi:predicted anti-sigma-YlaC factor YlaD
MSGSNGELGCAGAREAIHVSLDADLMDAGLKRRLEAHVAGCASCRAFASEMRAIQEGLRNLGELRMPDDVLEEVWVRTTRSRRAPARAWRLRLAAAAAVLVVVMAGLWLRNGSAPTEPTDAELAQAAREARMVLQLTSRALRRAERAAVRDVLTDEVSRALRRVPVQWPEHSAARRRGS